jgi:hypothetical protein
MSALAIIEEYLTRYGMSSYLIFGNIILVLLTIISGSCGAYGKYSLIYSIYSFIVAGFLSSILMIIFGYLTIRNLRQIHSRVRPNIIRISHINKKRLLFITFMVYSFLIYINSASTFYIYISTSRAYRHQCQRFIVYYWMKITKPTTKLSENEFRGSVSRRQQTTPV